MSRALCLASAALLVAAVSGCDGKDVIRAARGFLKERAAETRYAIFGDDRRPGASSTGAAAGAPAGSQAEDPSVAAARAKANSELLHELYRVVFMQEPRDRSLFGSYVDSMNQGASLEGLYNGFTHSAAFRELEENNRGASAPALRAFAEELAVIETELPEATAFTWKSARPLARATELGTGPSREDPGPAVATPRGKDPGSLRLAYLQLFRSSSIFTLKRVLGDEALKLIESKKASREGLAAWYGKWVARICGRNVDFGLALRNKADAAFHQSWARTASLDQLQWEVLNRLHRVLNDAQTRKELARP